jgi:ribonuclease D
VRFIGKATANLFDTQIAAGFMSLPYPVALSKLVMELLGVRLGKGLTFTQWDQRPLSSQQLRYAADDVRYLPAIRQIMGEKLEELGHLAWAFEESASICKPGLYRFDPQTYYHRVRGSGSLQPKQLAVLKELTVWRDAAARAADSPARAFLKDEILVDLSRNPVKSVDKLDRVRGLPRPVESEHGQAIVDAIARGLAVPPEQWPAVSNYEPTPCERFRCDAIWSLVQCIAASRAIDPNLVSSRQEIGEFYRQRTSQEECTAGVLSGWRLDAIGQKLLDILDGQADLCLVWQDELKTK